MKPILFNFIGAYSVSLRETFFRTLKEKSGNMSTTEFLTLERHMKKKKWMLIFWKMGCMPLIFLTSKV